MTATRFALPLLFILTLLGCAHSESTSTKQSQDHHPHGFEVSEVIVPESEATYFNHHDKVFFTEEFSVNDIEALKKWDVKSVIYLVEDIEPTPEMFERVEEEGMTVIPMDFQWEGKQARKLVAKIENTFMDHHKSKGEVLVVSSSNLDNVKGWLSYHLNKTHKMSVEEALAASESLGDFSSAEIKEKAAKLLK